jgi:hypothetical protein
VRSLLQTDPLFLCRPPIHDRNGNLRLTSTPPAPSSHHNHTHRAFRPSPGRGCGRCRRGRKRPVCTRMAGARASRRRSTRRKAPAIGVGGAQSTQVRTQGHTDSVPVAPAIGVGGAQSTQVRTQGHTDSVPVAPRIPTSARAGSFRPRGYPRTTYVVAAAIHEPAVRQCRERVRPQNAAARA